MTLGILAFLSVGTLMGTFIPIAFDIMYGEKPLKEVVVVFFVSLVMSLWVFMAGLTTSYSIKDYRIDGGDGTGAVYRVLGDKYYFAIDNHPELNGISVDSVNHNVEYHSYVSVIKQTAWIFPGVSLVDKTYKVNLYLTD